MVAPAAVQQRSGIVYNEAQKPDSPKTKLYILRSLADKGLCLIVEARNEPEAVERAKEIEDGSVPFNFGSAMRGSKSQ
jgi:hypothetical protein